MTLHEQQLKQPLFRKLIPKLRVKFPGELIFGVLPEPLDLAYWFLVIDLSDSRNWLTCELQPMDIYDLT